MLTCKNCSLQFNTEQELNVHTAQCYENMPESSVDSRICEYCKTIFITTAELTAHENTCKVKFRTMVTFQLYQQSNLIKSLNNNLNELKKALNEKPKQLKPVECSSCLLKFDTVEEVSAHKKTCKVLVSKNIMEQLSTFVSATWAAKQLPMISLPSTSSATSSDVMINPIDLVRALDRAWMFSPSLLPSTSQDWSKNKSARNRDLDTSTKVDCATQTDINQKKISPQVSALSPPLLTVVRSNSIDKKTIEKQPSLPSIPSTSKDCSVKKSPRKRTGDSDTKKEHATKSDFKISEKNPSQVSTFSSSSKKFRSSERKTDIEPQRSPPSIPLTSSKDCSVQKSPRKRTGDSGTKNEHVTKSDFKISKKVPPQVSPLSSPLTVRLESGIDKKSIEKQQMSSPPIPSTSSKDCSVQKSPRKQSGDSDTKKEHATTSAFRISVPPQVPPLPSSSTVFRFNDRDITPIEKPQMSSPPIPSTSSKDCSVQKSPRKRSGDSDLTKKEHATTSAFGISVPPQVPPLPSSSTGFRFNDRDITPIEKLRMSSPSIPSTSSKDCSVQNLRKIYSDSDIKNKQARYEFSLEKDLLDNSAFSLPSKMYCSSDMNKTVIETQQEMLKCAYCLLQFYSVDEFNAHYLLCVKRCRI